MGNVFIFFSLIQFCRISVQCKIACVIKFLWILISISLTEMNITYLLGCLCVYLLINYKIYIYNYFHIHTHILFVLLIIIINVHFYWKIPYYINVFFKAFKCSLHSRVCFVIFGETEYRIYFFQSWVRLKAQIRRFALVKWSTTKLFPVTLQSLASQYDLHLFMTKYKMSQNKMQTDGDTSVSPNKLTLSQLNNTIYLKNSFCFRLCFEETACSWFSASVWSRSCK